ncbi:MAG: NAD(P)-dependent oxidoreductase [Roseburia sp.]|nr:NAD(P)-dependent oxidoreductase [Roseburia sp.]
MENVLVTGGSGFIGSALVEYLVNNGRKVTVLRKNRTPLSDIREKKLSGATVIYIDLKQISQLEELDLQIDTCFHFAWDGISGSALSDWKTQLYNVEYCCELLRAVGRMGCKKFIGAGSFGQLELTRKSYLKGRENFYKCAKDSCENFCRTLAGELGIDFIWPMITNCYGVGEESNRFINSLLKRLIKNEDVAVSEGMQLYDFVYIDDVAKAFYLIGEYGKNNKQYVIGSGQAKPHREWIEPIPKLIGSSGNLKFGEYKYDGIYLKKEELDITELVHDTGFAPSVSFEKGIRMTADSLKTYK